MRIERRWSRRGWARGGILAAVVPGVLACAQDEPLPGGAMGESGRELYIEAVEATGPLPGPGGTVDLFRVRDMAAMGDTLVLAEVGNHRVVLVDRALRVLALVGGRGEGPGEFVVPMTIRANATGFLVYDLANQRFTEFARDGTYRSTIPSPYPAVHFAAASDGTLYLPGRSATHQLLKLRDGQITLFGPRRDTLVLDPEGIDAHVDDARIVVTAGDTVHVLDDDQGVLHKYAPDGRLAFWRRLPQAALDSAMQHRERVAEAFDGGRQPALGWLTKSMTQTSDGRLLVLATSTSVFGWVIDAQSYEAEPIGFPEDAALRQTLQAVPVALLFGGTLYTVTEDALLALRVSERRSS